MPAFALMIMLFGVQPPHPADRVGLFKAEDYPRAAAEANEQGVTKVRASVAPDGAPTGCQIVISSRSASLDGATCQIVMQRGRFIESAKLHRGKPLQIEWSVGWQLADADPTPFEVDMDRTIYTLSDGKITGCRSEVVSWRAAYPEACDVYRKVADADIALIPDERVLPGREYVFESITIPGDHRWDNNLGKGDGDDLVYRSSIVLTVEANGKVAACENGETQFRSAAEIKSWCERLKAERFAPLEAGADRRNPRKLTRVAAAYFRTVEALSIRE